MEQARGWNLIRVAMPKTGLDPKLDPELDPELDPKSAPELDHSP